jgi:hypothetical protein
LSRSLRELRRLVERPAAQDRDSRLVLALAAWMEPEALELPFDRDEVIEAARSDANLTAALEALGLRSAKALAYWLRSQRDRAVAGFVIRRHDQRRRTWTLERCR